ncbi:MAG: DNA mismatch repair protein MutS [Nitrospirae bacterium]|nr:DNA mismatch repair protein MutS [Nitrospirota bacterium]
MAELTPLMKQYFSIKDEYPDAIVFFRLGDFYEMFGRDAEIASSILQITLTTRDRGKDNPIPMCGIPYFSAEGYITKLIKAGYKVAICEQVEDPDTAKGIVRREVVRVITPGTHTPENPKENNFILAFCADGAKHGIAIADLSTGEFIVYESDRPLEDEITRFNPKEVLCPENLKDDIHYEYVLNGLYATYYDQWYFDYSEAYKTITEYFKVYSLEVFGLEELRAAVSSAGALINYLHENQKGNLVLSRPVLLRQSQFMFLDATTKTNLELTENLRDGTQEHTLLDILDETLTPMGGRFLRQNITRPLVDIELINKRLDVVETFLNDYELQDILRTYLRKIQDIERIATRILQRTANARDLIAMKNSLTAIPYIKKALSGVSVPLIAELITKVHDFNDLCELIGRAIVENPPSSLKEGGIIKDGFNRDVDELRALSTKSKDYITALERREKERTGISSLKIGFNKVFGYYIEVTKPNLHLVPDDYIRKQTLVNAERFITEELKDYENKVLGAEERLKGLEYELFQEILREAASYGDRILETARALGVIDFLFSLSIVAKKSNYVRPKVDDSGIIEIIEGRHPVLEKASFEERFIPNSTYMDTEEHRLLIITGPNMAGKSTYMRQTALIVLMAQMGSFVPAEKATIGIVDRIFTRIGASDYLSRGQSTFMVEMIETANILHNATSRSLIILDEVGRGTSTFDGISIAWAVAEYILQNIKARTLFATHYHELTEIAMTHQGVKNYNVAVKEWGEEIIFLRRIERGPADKSYGIHVARLAGLPEEVVKRAMEVLTNLESAEITETGLPRVAGKKGRRKTQQLDLFSYNYEPLISRLEKIDTDRITPEEALKRLKELKKILRESL